MTIRFPLVGIDRARQSSTEGRTEGAQSSLARTSSGKKRSVTSARCRIICRRCSMKGKNSGTNCGNQQVSSARMHPMAGLSSAGYWGIWEIGKWGEIRINMDRQCLGWSHRGSYHAKGCSNSLFWTRLRSNSPGDLQEYAVCPQWPEREVYVPGV